MTQSQARLSASRLQQLAPVEGFAEVFLRDGRAPTAGERLDQPGMAATLRHLVEHGLDSFYRGELAARNARFLEAAGSPLREADFNAYRAIYVTPLSLETSVGTIFNLPPPTQGIASLLILGVFDRLGVKSPRRS